MNKDSIKKAKKELAEIDNNGGSDTHKMDKKLTIMSYFVLDNSTEIVELKDDYYGVPGRKHGTKDRVNIMWWALGIVGAIALTFIGKMVFF